MPTTDPNIRSVFCPGCGARYDFPAEMAGTKGRCARCGTKFAVPKAAATPTASQPAPQKPSVEPAEPEPEYIGFECRLCQTRMYARARDVGKKMKCPDCHALTVIPPPPPPKKKNIPAALEGEQYELWDIDSGPLPTELVARQPKYIAVTCRKCATLIYAGEDQVGQSVLCPDCRTSNVVPAPPKKKPKVPVLTRDAVTPVLDPASAPGERPPAIIPPRNKMVYEELHEAAYAAALEKSRRTGRPMEIDHRGRPVIPRWPLITGVLPFLFSRSIPAVWLGLSAGFFGSLTLLIFGMEMAFAGYGAVAGMCFFALGSIATMFCAAAASGILLEIVTESSDGNREIQSWPGPQDWIGNLLPIIVAGMVSAIPGYFVAKAVDYFVGLESLYAGAAVVVSMLILLPIVLLSQLDISSPWGVLSPRILRSLLSCPFSWLLFYLEITLLAAACGAATVFVVAQSGNVLWLLPLYLLTLVLFARLLGRLAWRLAEAMPMRD